MKHCHTCLFIIILVTQPLFGQDSHLISKAYREGPLIDFVKEVEQNSDLKFFYKKEWIDSIYVNYIKKGASIQQVLESALNEEGYGCYIEANDVYIYPGPRIISQLPAYNNYQGLKDESPSETNVVPESGKKFLQTKSISEERFITIGSEEKAVNGSKCIVEGNITNQHNGEVLVGATVYIKKLNTGTISDARGAFQLKLSPGEYIISVNHMAMKEMEYGLNVLSSGVLDIALENELIELEEITVVDTRQSNVKGMLMGFERISTKSIKEIPVVLGEKDVIKVAQMLPGVQNVGEGSSGFNVRGGSADQNMFYINKISIYNTSHLFGFFTAFNPDIISDFSLYKNNMPAKYGGRIASVFEVNTREGNKNRFFAHGGISPVTGHISLEGPVIKNKVSFVASLRSTYSDWLLKRIENQDIRESNASFYDGTMSVNAEINANNQLEAFLYLSSDEFSLADKNDYQYSNMGASIHWKHRFSPLLSGDFSFANSDYQFKNTDKNNISEAYVQDYFIRHSEGRANFLLTTKNDQRIEFGMNSILYNLDRGDIMPFGEESKRIPVHLGREKGIENAIYISDEFILLPRLTFMTGLRYGIYSQLGPANVHEYSEGTPKIRENIEETTTYDPGTAVKTYSGFEPRASLNYGLGTSSSLKASYNRLRQYIFLLSNTIALAPTDQWKLTDYHITPPVSDQLSLGYYHDFRKIGLTTSFEIYKKWINHVVEYKDGADFISGEPIETLVLQGSQDSRGLEFMLKKTSGRLTGWLSYTYSRSKITIDGATDDEKINRGIPYPSNYDRPHSINVVSNYRISRRVSFSSNLVYTTGRPVTLPVATYYSEGKQYLLFSGRNEYRIPDYFRLDFSINLEGNLKYKKIAHSYWMLNIYNLTGRDNAYSVFYNAEDTGIKGYKLSVFAQPIITLSWNFKFGNYNSD